MSSTLATLLVLLHLTAQAQAWQWANVASTPPATTIPYTTATAISASGTVYAAYVHSGALTLGSQTYPGGSQPNAVMVRYDATGNVTGPPLLVGIHARISDLKTDRLGNLYAVGRFSNQLTAGATQLTTTTADYFVAKWNASGTLQWLQQGRGVINQTGFSNDNSKITVDDQGYVTIGTDLYRTVTFGNQTVTPNVNRTNFLLARFKPDGTLNWLRASANPLSYATIEDLAAAPDGTLHVVGVSLNRFTWGGATVPTLSAYSSNGFWLKLDTAGTLLNARRFELTNGAPLIAVDAAGGAYIALPVEGSVFKWEANTFTLPGQGGFILTSLNSNGVPRWVRSGSTPDSSNFEISTVRAVNAPNTPANVHVYVGGSYRSATRTSRLTYGSFSLPNTSLLNYDGFLLAVEGTLGMGEWLLPVVSSNSDDIMTSFDANTRGEISVAGYFTGDTAIFGGIRVANPAAWRGAGFLAKLRQSYNLAQGTVFTDVNANGTRDAGEFGRGGVIVASQPGNLLFSTYAGGQYNAVLDLGRYTLNVPNPPLYYTAVPAGPSTVTFSTYANLSTGHDFALRPVGPRRDLRMYLTPVGRARPGFAVQYRLTYTNVGTVPLPTGYAMLNFDPALTFVSSSETCLASGSTLTWNYANLQPGESRQIDVLFQLAITTPLGHALSTTATVEPLTGDLTPADNTETATLTVTGSYDPNDISVNYPTLTLPQVQNATKALDYTIRFQNMGTDTAFSVLLMDTLPADVLNLGTLQLLASSHTCVWRLAPGGILVVEMPNIELPDRNTNTLRSMGFVRFRVVPRVTLVAGDLIPNAADIHFDYNPPVTTNTALTTVVSSNGLPEEAAATALRVWPNPASGMLNVEVAAEAGDAVTLTLLDALGRPALTEAARGTARQTLDVRGLPAGLYLLRAEAGGRQWSRRVVVR